MEQLIQAGFAVFWICLIVFIVGVVKLIISKGKSKRAITMVVAPLVIVVAMLIIGFGTCVLAVLKH